MALIKCPECEKEISDQTTQCIHCGCPITKIKPSPKTPFYKSKKLIIIIVSIIVISSIFIFAISQGFFGNQNSSTKNDESLEEINIYLSVLGNDISDGNQNASQSFIDGMNSVEFEGLTGTVSHTYVESSSGTKTIDKLLWLSNDTVSEAQFNDFISQLDKRYNQYAPYIKDIDKSDKTYIWIDSSNSYRILCWYNNNVINLCWELDDIYSISAPKTTKKYNVPSDFIDEDFQRILMFFQTTYSEAGFDKNMSSNTMGTRYPIGKAKFLGKEADIQIWYSEDGVDTKKEPITTIDIFLYGGYTYQDIKKLVSDTLNCSFSKDEDTYFEVNIPNTNLVLSVYEGILSPEIYIVKNESKDSDNTTKPEVCIECGNTATKTYTNPISNEVEHYCLTHYNEIIDIMSGMEEDVGNSRYSSHTCEECSREGTHKYESFTGQTEYYCTQHYEELNDLLNSFGLD